MSARGRMAQGNLLCVRNVRRLHQGLEREGDRWPKGINTIGVVARRGLACLRLAREGLSTMKKRHIKPSYDILNVKE